MIKKILLFLCLLSLTACDNKKETLYETHTFFTSVLQVTTEIPEYWDYNIYPSYDSEYYRAYTNQVINGGEWDGAEILYFYCGLSEEDFISVSERSGAEKEILSLMAGEAETFVFADGEKGLRKVFDGDYTYKEQIYHPTSDCYVYVHLSKEVYKENETQIRYFLENVCFLENKVTAKSKSDSKVHIWTEALQAEFILPSGISLELLTDEIEFDTGKKNVFHLKVNETTSVFCGNALVENKREDLSERYELSNGTKGWKNSIKKDGQNGIRISFYHPDFDIVVLGDVTEEIDHLLKSFSMR